MLGLLINQGTQRNLVLRLFKNSVIPVNTHILAGYEELPVSLGYSSKLLTGSNWTVTEANPSEALYPAQVFTFTGQVGPVYGYMLTRENTSVLVSAERFSDGPYNIVNNGDTITISLLLKQR